MTWTGGLDLARKGQIVLVVDGDPNVLSATKRILRRGGYSVIAASGPLEALEMARAFPGEIHLLLTDVTMRDMNGIALAQEILTQRERLRVLLMSGNSKVESRLPLLEKPFRMDQLLEQAAKVISGPVPQHPAVNVDNVGSEATARRRELREAVHRAHDAYTRAAQKSKAIRDDAPSLLPHFDGVRRITNAAKEERAALEEYLRALRAFNDHANRKGKP
jgi:DNA-binding NtrC family response regulator